MSPRLGLPLPRRFVPPTRRGSPARWIALALAALVIPIALPASAQEAPPEEEHAGGSRGGYAWGEAPPEQAETGGAAAAYRRYGTAFVNLGFGGTIRIVAHADICNPDTPGREGCRFSPPYMQLRGGYMFETDSILQHGVGLGIGTNLAPDGTTGEGIDPFGQWVITPAYYARLWLDDWVQLLGHFGVPLGISSVTGTTVDATTSFNWALELEIDVVVKFLTGLGVYAGANIATWFGGTDSVWPTISIEGGLVFDYEVLP